MTQHIEHTDENGLRHNDHGPAVIYENGDQCWYQHGLYHREDGPAVDQVGGSLKWIVHGNNHRTNGPAIVHNNNTGAWYVNNILIKKGKIYGKDILPQGWFYGTIYSCFPNELVGCPIFDFLFYNTTDPITSKLA